MKKAVCTSILAVLIAAVTAVSAQDYPEEYLGLPGDNLNLYAVMKLFQESETLEAFERNLNDENSRINNLDLNGDNMVDYITVSDYVDGNVHTIVLRAALGQNEYQDVAVFTVEKFGNGSVQIQLIGDEALYGRNYIVEPIYAETPNPGYRGRTVYRNNVTVVTTTYYEVAAWPVIRYIYSPFYVCWRSSWYWDYYPVYWHPWRPWYWHYYYGYHYHWFPHYYAHYRHWHHPRYIRYHDFYYGSIRAHSYNVSRRINEGQYRQTYSRPELRREGEALYSRTHGSRNTEQRSYGSATGTDRRSSAAVSSRSAGTGNPGQSGDVARRSPSQVQTRSEYRQPQTATRRSPASAAQRPVSSSATRSEMVQRSSESSRQSTVQRSQTSVQRSQSSVQRSQAAVQRSQPSAQRSQAAVQRSQPSVQRSQAAVQRSQPSAQRSQAAVQRSQPSVQRSQAAVQRSQPSVQRSQAAARSSQPSMSRSSAPMARSQSHSSSQGRSSGNVTQKSSSSRSSDDSRSSRR